MEDRGDFSTTVALTRLRRRAAEAATGPIDGTRQSQGFGPSINGLRSGASDFSSCTASALVKW